MGFQDAFWKAEERTIQCGNLDVQKRRELAEANSWSRKMMEWKESKELEYLYLLDQEKGKTDGYRNRCFELELILALEK